MIESLKAITTDGIITLELAGSSEKYILQITQQYKIWEEAVQFALNIRKDWLASAGVSWFDPLIREHRYSPRHKEFSIVRYIGEEFKNSREFKEINSNDVLWRIRDNSI
jgi:hypothetical protein